jgi:hypothetical protein
MIVEVNLRPFHEAMDDLKQGVNFVSEKFDFLTMRVSEVEGKCEEALTENKFLRAEILRLSNVIKQHSKDISNIEQYSRRDSVEISGLPEESNKDTNALTIKVGCLMGLKINESDISVSHRLPLKHQSQSYSSRLRRELGLYQILLINIQKMIVKFVKRETKDLFYGGRRHLKDKTTR